MKDSGDISAMRERIISNKIWIEMYKAIASAMPESAGGVLRAANIATDAAIDALRGPRADGVFYSIGDLQKLFPQRSRKFGNAKATRLKARCP